MSAQTEYLFAYLLTSLDEGNSFIDWPLHITLLPWFKLDVPLIEFGTELKKLLGQTESFAAPVGPPRQFSRRSVNLIAGSAELLALHELLLAIVKNNGEFTVSRPYLGNQFKPHITKSGNRGVKEGRLLKINRVYLISAYSGNRSNRPKKVTAKFQLGEL